MREGAPSSRYMRHPSECRLVEIAATLTARYRRSELTHGHGSVLIGLLGKLGFSPRERGALNLPTKTT
jgi:hypothetical protein